MMTFLDINIIHKNLELDSTLPPILFVTFT